MLLLLLACAPTEPSETAGPGFIQPPEEDGEDPVVVDDSGEPEDTDEPVDTSPVFEEVDPPDLLLNEVMTNNTYSFNVADAYPDWIEVYNASAEAIGFDRVSLVDSSGRSWYGTADLGEILPGAYAVIYADGQGTGAYAPFSLDGDGDTLILKVDGYVTDRMATGDLPSDVSWARIPDGGDWLPTAWSTPAATNGDEASPSLDPSENLFSLSRVHDISFTGDPSAIASLSTTYIEVAMEIGGVELDPVGLRLRGSMTYQPITSKAAFKADLNRYEDFRFGGQEKFNILNMYYEPSYIREWLGYRMFRDADVPAIRTAYAWVDVNGTDYGLYLLSQAYDDTFLREWFGNSDGFMWEPNSGDFTSGASWWDCEEGDCDTSVITPVAQLLNSTSSDANVAEMETYLALDSVLREIAMELIIGQWDGYCSPHNYRIYYNPDDGLLYIMPSSLDLTYDNYGDYGFDLYSCGGSVLSWCRENASCSDRYDQILLDLADMIEENDYDAQIDEVIELIDPYVYADDSVRAQYDYARYQVDVEYVRNYMATLPDDIRDQVASH